MSKSLSTKLLKLIVAWAKNLGSSESRIAVITALANMASAVEENCQISARNCAPSRS